MVVWQTAHVAVLLDLSYVLNNAYRIASGDVPYRDFPLPYPPLTLVVQSSLIRLFGTHYLVHAAYSVILDAASTALTYWIVVRVVRDRWMATVLCLPLVVLGVQDIYPHPFYDPDATFLTLAVIGAAFWASNTEGNIPWAAVGALLPVPILVKQNTGLAFFALMLLAVASTLVRGRPRALMALAAGALATFAVGSLILQLTAGLDNVARWTVTFAAGRLSTSAPPLGWLANPAALGFATLSLAGYAALRLLRGRKAIVVAGIAITYPYVLVTLLSFIAPERAPILAVWPLAAVLSCVAGTVSMMRGDGGFAPLLPFVCVGVATASFLSQDVYGSSYALWPLLVIACAVPARRLLDGPHPSRMVARIALPSIGALVLTAGAAYALGESRLGFLRLEGPELKTLPVVFT